MQIRVCVLDQGAIKLIDTPDKLKADFKMENLEDVFIALDAGSISLNNQASEKDN